VTAGRFAPSPSGDLHVGNLRTAVLAWLFARTTERAFRLRIEDLDRVAAGATERQLADLASLGLTWDGPVVRQSDRIQGYRDTIEVLRKAGLTYECFCTRREIQSAGSAPHGLQGAYPGTCRALTSAQLTERRRSGRPPALRLRAEVGAWTVTDQLTGPYTGPVDDLVLQRGDGVVAYNLAVVVDDAAQGIDQIVRGNDLLTSAPRQAYLRQLLHLPAVIHAHVPLALTVNGARLAKRDGAVTMTDLRPHGYGPAEVLSRIGVSLRLAEPGEVVSLADLAERFDPAALPREPWTVDPARWAIDTPRFEGA
jgi:glutamyl-tRNA synthetase